MRQAAKQLAELFERGRFRQEIIDTTHAGLFLCFRREHSSENDDVCGTEFVGLFENSHFASSSEPVHVRHRNIFLS